MSLSSFFGIAQPTDCLRAALNMLTEYEQANEDSDRPKMVVQRSFLPSLTFRLSHPQRLFKWPPRRHTGVIDYPLGTPDTWDTYLTIPHMVSHPSPFTAHAYLLKHSPQPFSLDYTQILLSPRHTLRVLLQARETPRAVALPSRIAAHAWPLAAPGRVLALPNPVAGLRDGRRALERRARLNCARRAHRRQHTEQPPAELDARARRARAQGR
jgi:hypothetical protein